MPIVKVRWDAGADRTLPLPSYESMGAAGADLRANLAEADRRGGLELAPGERILVPTGLIMQIPQGHELQIRPRSGLALKHGVTLVNAPGTIDADYRGPVGVVLINLGQAAFAIRHGDRVAQAVLAPVVQAEYSLAETLGDTARGSGGFGSTGQA